MAQPIFDRLRRQKRDALTALVMVRLNVHRVEQLFEHFLIDPGMEPVVQTSRVRLAISSVQAFVQRCLLNLEPRLRPSAINASHWEWMKRYRVWEANRKLFLFPENWLEPEFRDDKSHLFKALEGDLLQGDVSTEAVEGALHRYLEGLNGIARLQIVATYAEDRFDLNPGTLHVIARTFSAPHVHFYRRYSNRMWTPWEPAPGDVQGDMVFAAMWRQRLHLFWVTSFQRPSEPASAFVVPSPGDPVLVGVTTVEEVRLNWSEYVNGSWTAANSADVSAVDNSSWLFILSYAHVQVSKDHSGGEEHALTIRFEGWELEGRTAIRFTGKNNPLTRAHPRAFQDEAIWPISNPGDGKFRYPESQLQVWHNEKLVVRTEQGKVNGSVLNSQPPPALSRKSVLRNRAAIEFSCRGPMMLSRRSNLRSIGAASSLSRRCRSRQRPNPG